MKESWQLQNSGSAVKTVLFLALLPPVLAFLLNITMFAKISVVLLSPVFFFLLYNNIVLPGTDNEYRLSWSEGSWAFSSQSSCKDGFNIQGIKNKKSFSLGFMMLLSITDKNNQSVDLWLFPDSIGCQRNSGQHNSWRRLHCCYLLADEKSDQFIRKV